MLSEARAFLLARQVERLNGKVGMTEHDLDVMRFCVKSYLSHMRLIKDDIREIEIRIREIKDRLGVMAVDYSKDAVSTSSDGDRIGEAIAHIEELQEELSVRIINYQNLLADAQDMCQPHYVGRYAMWLHEVEQREWEYVGRIIGYSERQTRTIAEGGLREIYELMPEEYRRYSIPNALP